jgi:hypothetical protein
LQLNLKTLILDSQTSAGVYYAKDISGDVTGTVTNSGGAAFKYGQNTDNPVTMSGMTISPTLSVSKQPVPVTSL